MVKKIKVLVVDDCVFMRKVIMDILNKEEDIEVIDIAKDGNEAILKVEQTKPDVITMDVEMPILDGISSLEKILTKSFIPVIMFSSVTSKGALKTMQALELGAVDFITKPSSVFDIKGNTIEKELVSKVRAASKVEKIENSIIKVEKVVKSNIVKSSKLEKYIIIGSSTGGPRALYSVIPNLQGKLPIAVILIQHMPPGFTKTFAERLDLLSELSVVEAKNNDIIKPGTVYIAPGGFHTTFKKSGTNEIKVLLTKDDPVGGHRPSIDVTMSSLSRVVNKNVISVIMTGMGADGSIGVKVLKEKNDSYVIAQNEESCVVYGMPKVAISSGVVDKIVPLNEITKEITKILGV